MYSKRPVALKAGEFHLSPNELELAVRLEAQRRRLLRLSQVRQQSHDWSTRVRRRCSQAETREARRIVSAERAEKAADRLAEADELASAYAAALASLGQSHRAAEAMPDAAAEAAAESATNQAAAEQRHAVALDVLREARADADEKRSRAASMREAALVTERERSARIAALPPPPPPPYAVPFESAPLVAHCDGDAMDTRFYGAPPEGYQVAKATASADAPAETAADAAEAETARYQATVESTQRQAELATERAAVRGHTALRREFVQQAYQQMLTDLAGLHRTELHNRQMQFGQLPRDIQHQQQFRSMYSGTVGRSQAERVFEQRFLLESGANSVGVDMQLRDNLDEADNDVEMRPRPGIPLPTERSPQKPTPEDNDNEAEEQHEAEQEVNKSGAAGTQGEQMKPLLERINRQKKAAQSVDTRLDLSRLVEAGQIRSQVHERLRALERDIAERERFLGEPTAAVAVVNGNAGNAIAAATNYSSNPDSGFSTARTGAAPLSSDRQRHQQQLLASRLEPLNEEQAELQRLENEYAMLEERLARLRGEGDAVETRSGEAGNDSGAEDLTYRDYNDSDRPAAPSAAVAVSTASIVLPASNSAPFLANNASSNRPTRRDSIASSAASSLNERVREFQRRALQRLGSTQTVSSAGGVAPTSASAAGTAPAAANSIGVQTARSSIGRDAPQHSLPLSCSCSSCGGDGDLDETSSVASEQSSSTVVSCPRHARQHPTSRRSRSQRSQRPVKERAHAVANLSPSATVAAKLRSAKRQLEIEREKEDLMQQFLRLRLLQEQRAQLDNLVASLGSTTAAAAAAAAAAAVASTASVSVNHNSVQQLQQLQPPAIASVPEAENVSCSCDANSTSIETDYEYDDNYCGMPAAANADDTVVNGVGIYQPMMSDSVSRDQDSNQRVWKPKKSSPAKSIPIDASFVGQQFDCGATLDAASLDNPTADSSMESSAAPSYLPEFLPLAVAPTRQQQQQQLEKALSEDDGNVCTDNQVIDFFSTFGSGGGHRPPPAAVAIRHPNLAVEQQHELSTIAEVDTPTATTLTAAAFSSTLRYRQSQLREQAQQMAMQPTMSSSVDDLITEAFGDGRGDASQAHGDYDDFVDDDDDADSCSPYPDGIEISGGVTQLHVQAQKIRLLREYFAANAHRLAELRVSDDSVSTADASGISQRPLSVAAIEPEDDRSQRSVEDQEDDYEDRTLSAIDVADANAVSLPEPSPTRTMPLVSTITAATVKATQAMVVTSNSESTMGYGVVSQVPLADSSTVESFNLTIRPISDAAAPSAAPSSISSAVSQALLADSNTLVAAQSRAGFTRDTNSIVSSKSGLLSQAPLSVSLTRLNTRTAVGSSLNRPESSRSTGLLDAAGIISQIPLADSSIVSTVKPYSGSDVGSAVTSTSTSGVDVVSQQPLPDSSTATTTQQPIGGSSDGISQHPLSSTSAASSVITVAQSSSAVTMPVVTTGASAGTVATGESSLISQHHVSSGSPSASLVSFRRHELELAGVNAEFPSATLPALPILEPAFNTDTLLGTTTSIATIHTATEAVRKRAEQKQQSRRSHRDSSLCDVSSSSDIQRDIERLQTALEAWKSSRMTAGSDSASIDAVSVAASRAPVVSTATVVTKDSEQRKAQEQNAVQRSRRLYQNLEEVQRRRLVDERRQERRENLQKAKEFNRRMREETRRKQQQKQKLSEQENS